MPVLGKYLPPSSSQQRGFYLGTVSNMMLTLISGWMRRVHVWIMATRDRQFCGFQVESLLSALPIGKSLVWSKANQAVKLKKK